MSIHSVHMLESMLSTHGSVEGLDDTCGVCLDVGDFVIMSCKHKLCGECLPYGWAAYILCSCKVLHGACHSLLQCLG